MKSHLENLSNLGVTIKEPYDSEGVMRDNLLEVEKAFREYRSHADENMSLKEETGKLRRELREINDHLTGKISELHALFEVSTSITMLTDSGKLYEEIPEAIKRYLGIEEIALFTHDENEEGLVPVSYSNSLTVPFDGLVISPGEGVVGKVFLTGESSYIPDLSKTSEFIYSRTHMKRARSFIAVPVKSRDRTTGVFTISHPDPSMFDAETLGTVKTLVRIISIALENAQLYQYAKMLAERDSLTILFNHGTFHSRLKYELERGARYERPLSVIMLDIDGFKLVNDNFGHATGDRILKMVAGVINAHTRSTDIASRYGGDEFAIMLPETKNDGAFNIARRICDGLKNMRIDTGKGGDINVTASFGVATCDFKSDGREKIVELADQLMYKAKSKGTGEIECKLI